MNKNENHVLKEKMWECFIVEKVVPKRPHSHSAPSAPLSINLQKWMLSTHVENGLVVNMDYYLTNCDYNVESSHISVRRGEGRTIKSAMSPSCRKYKSIVCFFLFLVCLWLSPSFWKKDECCPDTNFGSSYVHFEHVIDTKSYNNMHHRASIASSKLV